MEVSADEEAIWQVIIEEHIAYWMRDFEGIAARHVREPYERWWARQNLGGATLNNGWEALAQVIHNDIRRDPERNPFFAYHARFENRMVHVNGNMAFATYDICFPTEDMPGFSGPGTAHDLVVLELLDGLWKVAALCLIDDQFGQTSTPVWQIDGTGRVLRQNPAAAAHLKTDTEMTAGNGKLHIRHAETDRRLHEAIGWASGIEPTIVAPNVARAVVFDPGNDLPARTWWVGLKGQVIYVAFNDSALASDRVDRTAETLGLSPSQRRIAISIVEGLSVIEAAKREGIRPSSARTQLQRIFDKVGVRTQPALVRALLSATKLDGS